MAISGRLLADVRRFPSECSGLLEVDRVEARGVEGRTELQLPECPAPLLQGWRVQATGVLRRPLPAVHPLLPGSAERLARQGSWSQLRAESIEVLQRPWTPLADLRRDVAQRLQQAVGPRRGGFLAALVLGSAQVQLPEDIRAAFRMAGLSHALAASGFHLSLLLGSVLVLGLLPWLLGAGPCRRCWSLIPLATALLVHGLMQLGDGLVTVERFDRHWLLGRHRGRAALVSTHGDARSCRMAKKLAALHGHARLDWVLLLDPVATDVLACWQALAHRVEAPQQGQAPIAIGQVLRSDGLSVQRLQSCSGALVMRVGHQRWQLVPSPQALWALQQRQRSEPRQLITGTWLGFKPSAPQRRWLLKHGAGARFVGL